MTEQHGPPKEVEGRTPHHRDRPSTSRYDTAANRTAQSNAKSTQTRWAPCTCDSPRDIHSQLELRRQAANRSVPLDCGCRDSWLCRCTEPPLSDPQLDSWRDAAEHILASGLMPAVPIEVRRALWRRPADRRLAELLHLGCGEAIT